MMRYTLVTQQWVATRPVRDTDFNHDNSNAKLHNPSPASELITTTHTQTPSQGRGTRLFSTVTSNKIEANRIRARLTRPDVARMLGITLSALNDIIDGECIIPPNTAIRLRSIFNRDITIYPLFPHTINT